MKKKYSNGFSIIELLIVIVILIVTVGMWVMNRKSQLRGAYAQEARVLINDIVAKENLQFDQVGNYTPINVSSMSDIGVDTRRNMYFRTFEAISGTSNIYLTHDDGSVETRPSMAITVNAFGIGEAAGMIVSGTYTRDNGDFKFSFTGL